MSITRKAVTRLTLDLSMPDVQKSMSCTLGDRNRRIEILVTSGGEPFKVPNDCSAILMGKKPDGTELANGCVVENGMIVYEFESGDQIATCAGRYAVTVWIVDSDGDSVAAPKFWLNVFDSGAQEIVESNDQFTVLQELIGGVADLRDELDAGLTNTRADLADTKTTLDGLVRLTTVRIGQSEWTDGTPKEATIAFTDAPGKTYTDVALFLLIPADAQTREASQSLELSVIMTTSVAGYLVVIKIARESGATADLFVDLNYHVLMIRPSSLPDGYKPTAEFVGVVNLPDRFMEREVARVFGGYIDGTIKVDGFNLLDLVQDIRNYNTPTAIDLSRMDEGEIVETFSDGSTKTTTIEYNADGNPVKITDGDGNETVLTW